jgi:hypothetical protein
MKNIIRLFMASMMALATIGFASCEKEPANNNQPGGDTTPAEPVYETLVGTEWEGTYSTTTQTQYGAVPCTIHWTVDFLRDGRGEVMFWLESQAFDSDQYSWQMTYTYDGHNAGVITDEDGSWPFTCDPYNRTMNVTLQFRTQHEEGGQMFTYGGPTTLHQTR